MTRAFADLPQTASIDAPEGGIIRANDDGVYAPESIYATETGAAFGPVHLETPEQSVCNLNNLTFLPGEDDDSGWLSVAAVAGTGAAAEHRDTPDPPGSDTTRRGVLTLLVAILGAAAITDTASADEDELITLNVAELELEEPEAPVTLALLDVAENVLPPTTDVLVDQENARVGTIADAGEGVTLRQVEGPVRIYIRDTLGRLTQLLAWARSFLPEDSSLTYRRTFPNGNQASDYEPNEFVRLTSHPAIVDPIREADADRTVFEINSTEIPHIDDGASEAGAWTLLDDTLIYEVGENPPAEDEWQVTTRLSAWQAFRY